MVNITQTYFDNTRLRPPTKLLIQAVSLIRPHGFVLDLGCGAMRDTRYLLDKGFTVTALDSSDLILNEAKILDNPNLNCVVSKFDQYEYPQDKFDIVNAISSLSFNSRQTFNKTVNDIKKSIKVNGIFCGSFFGTKDSWNTQDTTMTFLSGDEINNLFKDFKVILFNEKQEDGVTALGEAKHWHIYSIIARKTR